MDEDDKEDIILATKNLGHLLGFVTCYCYYYYYYYYYYFKNK